MSPALNRRPHPPRFAKTLGRWGLVLPASAAAALVGVHAASAQSGPDSYYPTSVPVGVRNRPRPDYAALGLQLGAFELYPSLTISPQYDDNILATSHNTQSDLVTSVAPSVVLQSNWARNAISAAVGSTSNFYASHSVENTTNYQMSANGRLDLRTEDNVSAGFSYAHSTEARTATDTLSTGLLPVQFDSLSANIGALQTITRLRFSETASVYRTSFGNNVTSPQFSSQNLANLNNNAYDLTGRADYAITPELAFFLSTQFNDRVYDKQPPVATLDRNSTGFETTVGATFAITRLIKGQAQFGYLQQSYRSKQFQTVNGPAVHVNVEYNPTELTTLSLNVDSSVVDAQDPSAISLLQTTTTIGVDHELFPNVILSGRAGYEDDSFKGIKRDDRRPTGSFTATYLLNRHLGLTGGYSFLGQDSTGLAGVGHYAVNVLSLSLNLQL